MCVTEFFLAWFKKALTLPQPVFRKPSVELPGVPDGGPYRGVLFAGAFDSAFPSVGSQELRRSQDRLRKEAAVRCQAFCAL